MIKKITVFCLFLALTIPAVSQETTTKKRTGRPDIPGTFVMELGLNSPRKATSDFSTGFWGSRSLNIYYTYDFRILKSRFSFVPGIGVSLERWKFKNGYILSYDADDSLKMNRPVDIGLSRVAKSQLITNYLEIPLELCYRTRPDDPARSFKIAVGARFGYMFDSFTKVKYREGGEIKKIKDKQDFELNKFRYSLTARVGLGNISLFGYYNMTPLFEKGKGPLDPKTGQKDFNTLTIGISLASF
jgi:hypothetical protein